MRLPRATVASVGLIDCIGSWELKQCRSKYVTTGSAGSEFRSVPHLSCPKPHSRIRNHIHILATGNISVSINWNVSNFSSFAYN